MRSPNLGCHIAQPQLLLGGHLNCSPTKAGAELPADTYAVLLHQMSNVVSNYQPASLLRFAAEFIALANKMARMAWAIMAHGGVYETPANA